MVAAVVGLASLLQLLQPAHRLEKNMNPTYVSRPFNFLDVPIPSKVTTSFYYYFFEKNERAKEWVSKPSDPIFRIPRFVKINWEKVQFDPIRSVNDPSSLKSIGTYKEDIVEEPSILLDSSIIYFQEFEQEVRIGERFKSSARLRGIASGSNTDIAAKLAAVTEDTTDNDIIQRYVSLNSQKKSIFVKSDEKIEPSNFSNADQLTLMVGNDYVVNFSRESATSPVNSAAFSIRKSLKKSFDSLRKSTSKIPTLNDVELELSSIEDRPFDLEDQIFVIKHHGYIIDRYEVDDQGTVSDKRSFYINSTNVNEYKDSSIKYGLRYVYSVRTLASFYVNVVDGTRGLQRSRFLISSRPSPASYISAEENVPPPVPADFNFYWDYQNASLQIAWSFPVNIQRDIKGWQVFRRSNLDEPFSLIQQIDFDDSTIKTPSRETVDKSLVRRYESPVNFFIDPDFTKDSSYIYAVVSVDAHGMTSNYSSQFQVSFDRIKNKLKKTLVSPAGAMKQYPNTYLRAELSIDSVKSVGKQKMRIYFDPEYLKVTNNDGRDYKVLKTNEHNGLYRFTLLNLDRQLQANLDVNISDLRDLRSEEKSTVA
jgi:hypothetical protein